MSCYPNPTVNGPWGACQQPTRTPTCYPTQNPFVASAPGPLAPVANPVPPYPLTSPPASLIPPPSAFALGLYQAYLAQHPV